MSDILSSYNSFGKLNIVTDASSTIPQLVIDLLDSDTRSWNGDRISFSYTSGGYNGSNHFRITENSYTNNDKINFELFGENNIFYSDIEDTPSISGITNNLFIYSKNNTLNLSSNHNSYINSNNNKLANYGVSGISFIQSNSNEFNKFTNNDEIVSAVDMSFYNSDKNFIRGTTTSANGVTFLNSNGNYYQSDDNEDSQKVLINTNNCLLINDEKISNNIVSIGNDYGYITNSDNVIAIGKGLYCSDKENKIILGQFNKNPSDDDILVIGDGSMPEDVYDNLTGVYASTDWNDQTSVNNYLTQYSNISPYRHNIFAVNSNGYIQIYAEPKNVGTLTAQYSFSGIKFNNFNTYGRENTYEIPFKTLYDSLKSNEEVVNNYNNLQDAINNQLDNITKYIPNYYTTSITNDYTTDTISIDDLVQSTTFQTEYRTDVADNSILLVKNVSTTAKTINYGDSTTASASLPPNAAKEFIKVNNAWLIVE